MQPHRPSRKHRLTLLLNVLFGIIGIILIYIAPWLIIAVMIRSIIE